MSIIYYGTRFYGKMNYFKGQGITTKFGHLWFMPFIPLKSYYVLQETDDGVNGYELPFQGMSILKTYIQWWMPLISIFLMASGSDFRNIGEIIQVIGGGLGILAWFYMLIFLKKEKDPKRIKQRLVFGSVIKGLYAHPDMLPPNMQSDFLQQLQNNWETLSGQLSLKSWEHTTAAALRQLQNSQGFEKLPNLLYTIHLLYKEVHKTDKYDDIIEEIEPLVLESIEVDSYTAEVKETTSCPHCFEGKIPAHAVKCPHCNKPLSIKKSNIEDIKGKSHSDTEFRGNQDSLIDRLNGE